MTIDVEFTNTEKILGYVNVPSGSLLLVDGAFENDLPMNHKHCLVLDLHLDNSRIPIVATRQGGRRFLLIPVDSAQLIINNPEEYIDTEDPLDLPENNNEEEETEEDE